MKTMIDIYGLLKKFGTIIYTGDRIGDLDLMEEELRELYQTKMIEPQQFQSAILILRQEKRTLEARK